LENAAIRSLDSPDLEVVIDSIEILGKYGSARAEEPLFQRFQKWHDEWKDKAEELQSHIAVQRSESFNLQRRLEAAYREALVSGQGWYADKEKLKKIESLCLNNMEREQTSKLIGESELPKKRLGLNDLDWSFNIAQYRVKSLDAARAKLSQFPKGTIFSWTTCNSSKDSDRQKAIYEELKVYLSERGMILEKID
jgi:hypothetical protein